MAEHKTDINITEKFEQHFYRRIQNWDEHDQKTEQDFYTGTPNRTQLHFGESNNNHTRMFASCFDKVEWFYDRDKGFINKLYTCLPLLENFMRIFVSCFDKVEWFFSEGNFLDTIQYNSH